MGGALVLDGRHLTGRRNNQPNDSVGGGGGIGEKLRASGTRGVLHLLVGLGDKLSGGKIKIERGTRPRISMASAGWEDATTNRKAAVSFVYCWGRRVRRAMTTGGDAVASFQLSNKNR